MIRQLQHRLLQRIFLDARYGSTSNKHWQQPATHATEVAVHEVVHVSLKNVEHLTVVRRLRYKFQHLLRVDQTCTHHGREVLSYLPLAFQEHPLYIQVPTTNDVWVDRVKDHVDGKPIRKEANEETRYWQHPEVAKVCVEVQLKTTQEESQHPCKVNNKMEFSATDLLEHLHQKRLVGYQRIDGHLLQVKDVIDVGLDVRHHGLKHTPALLHHTILELGLHSFWNLAPHFWVMLLCESTEHHAASCTQHVVHASEEIRRINAVDELLHREQPADHDVTCTRRKDSRAPGNDTLPTETRRDADELYRIPTHLYAKPDVPDCENNG
mmetsp:Transcript_41342/g.109529  ORF Transcript_41342/g.109529 Transcript_41342/m.109529 type:complete len:324 (-) Transcript_41342:82-1053(-)